MSRIVLYNPHVDDFLAQPPHFRLLGRRALKKYGFVIDESIRTGTGVDAYVDGTLCAFLGPAVLKWLPAAIRRAVARCEFRLWRRINGFSPQQVRLIARDEVRVDDVLFAFSYKAATGFFAPRLAEFARFRHVVAHLSHYFISTAEKSRNLGRVPNCVLAGDADPTDNPYFRNFFGWYGKDFLVLPFAVQDRFSRTTSTRDRKPMVVATGTIHDLRRELPARNYRDYIAFTGQDNYHPVRKLLYEHKEALKQSVDCRIAYYRDYSRGRLSNALRKFDVRQKKYFSTDIVALYNENMFAVVGEELSGFPALGAFEACACSAIVLAQPQYYKGTGLQAGEHFLAHDGTLEGILGSAARARSADVEQFSLRASAYVLANFNPRAAAVQWRDTLEALSHP